MRDIYQDAPTKESTLQTFGKRRYPRKKGILNTIFVFIEEKLNRAVRIIRYRL